MDDWLKAGGMALVMALLVGFTIYFALVPAEEPVERTSTSYGWLQEESITVTATGTAGSASGNTDSDGPIRGHIYAIHIDFTGGITTTTDTTITLADPSLTIMTLSNSATDAWFYPVVQQTNSAAGGTSTYDRVPVSGRVNVAIAQSTAADTVVTVWWGE
jgi:hypothetical protein